MLFLKPRVDFINVQRTAFTLVDPETAKNTVKSSVFFTLLGSTSVKPDYKYVGEIEPRCQFHQHFIIAFFIQTCLAQIVSYYSVAL